MKLLFIVPYVPNLIRVRPYQILRTLVRQGHEITLATLWSNEDERRDLDSLKTLGIQILAERLTKGRALWNVASALLSTRPLQTDYCWHPKLAQRLVPLVIQGHFDAIHVEHLRGALYGLHVKRAMMSSGMSHEEQIPVIWDSVDCISHLFSQAASQSRSLKGRLMTGFDLKRTQRYEGFLVNQFEHVLTTSVADAKALAQLAVLFNSSGLEPDELVVSKGQVDDAHVAKISPIPNGVDLAYFQPNQNGTTHANSADAHPKDSVPNIVFSGKMSYHANVSAALYLVNEIMPHVWAKHPEVEVRLVGKDPAPEVRRLTAQNRNGTDKARVVVTGTVPDLRPYLTDATVAVAPVPYGAGIQNKVLEAMACGAPVVSSAQAASGTFAKPDVDLLVADDAEGFGNAISRLLDDSTKRDALSRSARCYVEAHHSWDRVGEALVKIYQTYA